MTPPTGTQETSGGSRARVAVVGSTNLDLVVPVDRHPRPGETVLGGDHFRACGGKGANQAVAAARLGGDVVFVGLVGDDDAGRMLARGLADAGVDVSSLEVRRGVPSGIAMIAVDPTGENTIVVSPGANARLGAEEVHRAGEALAGSHAVLLQLEVPLEAVVAAARVATGTVILNPAPAAPLPDDLLDHVDVLVPNRTELALLAGRGEVRSIDEVARAARAVRGVERVVVTLGADGVLIRHGDAVDHLPPHQVRAVDTTAAGDAFCAALAVGLADGRQLSEAAAYANAAGALAVTRAGAQPSLPTRDAVSALQSQSVGERLRG